jgi:hypothetical protein
VSSPYGIRTRAATLRERYPGQVSVVAPCVLVRREGVEKGVWRKIVPAVVPDGWSFVDYWVTSAGSLIQSRTAARMVDNNLDNLRICNWKS